jgi:hypothetical protein
VPRCAKSSSHRHDTTLRTRRQASTLDSNMAVGSSGRRVVRAADTHANEHQRSLLGCKAWAVLVRRDSVHYKQQRIQSTEPSPVYLSDYRQLGSVAHLTHGSTYTARQTLFCISREPTAITHGHDPACIRHKGEKHEPATGRFADPCIANYQICKQSPIMASTKRRGATCLVNLKQRIHVPAP